MPGDLQGSVDAAGLMPGLQSCTCFARTAQIENATSAKEGGLGPPDATVMKVDALNSYLDCLLSNESAYALLANA